MCKGLQSKHTGLAISAFFGLNKMQLEGFRTNIISEYKLHQSDVYDDASSCRCRGTRSPQRSNNELFQLDNEEKHETGEEEPWPNPQRYGGRVEQCLEWRRIGEQQLQYYDSAYP